MWECPKAFRPYSLVVYTKLTCLFQKWKYYIDYEHMTVNTEGFDSKCMWYLNGDCILTKFSFYRSALTFIIAISEHISLECHPSIYRHPLYNAKCEFPQRWRYKGGGLYIMMTSVLQHGFNVDSPTLDLRGYSTLITPGIHVMHST